MQTAFSLHALGRHAYSHTLHLWVIAIHECASLMAQGGIDGGGHENPMTAAVRELKEETGISSARIVALVCPHSFRPHLWMCGAGLPIETRYRFICDRI